MVPVNVTEATEKQLHVYWSDDDIVEIMGVIALFGYLNRWNDVMATSLELDASNSNEVAITSFHRFKYPNKAITPIISTISSSDQ